MLAKILGRKVSRMQFESPDPTQLSVPAPSLGAIGEDEGAVGGSSKVPSASSPPKAGSSANGGAAGNASSLGLPLQYEYQRPELLGDYSKEQFKGFEHHHNRPIVIPKSPLPSGVGYAETINAGKSRVNEDQACVIKAKITGVNGVVIPYMYIGIFDGHGGPGAAIKVNKEMHTMLHEGLEDVLPYIVDPESLDSTKKKDPAKSGNNSGSRRSSKDWERQDSNDSQDQDDSSDYEDETIEVKMTLDELVSGALESTFWAMDRLIQRDKEKFRISGGCTAMVALFICDKLFVANAGDSRAGLYLERVEETSLFPMSYDFTPENDRKRIQHIAFHRPELLRHPNTREKLFNRHLLSRKVTKDDIGSTCMYRDYYMTGWSCRNITADDVNLVPVISGRGKLCRLLSTVGVARSLGDHDLLAKGCGIRVKEFLTPEPEVRVFELNNPKLANRDCLILGTDGLWDVLNNQDVKHSVADQSNGETPQELARHLVERARGEKISKEVYWEMKDGRMASGDDITGIVVNLLEARKIIAKPVDKKKNKSASNNNQS